MIELENITKIYWMGSEEIHALNKISLKVQDGEFVSIIGPSGSGKSTLMHVIGGLDRPDRGKIKVGDIDLRRASDKSLANFRNKQIGFVFQTFNLQPTLTALENVSLPLVFAKVRGRERVQRATAALEKVGLKDRMHHRPSELSGGQRQRVSIARALVNNPTLILADEPTGNLDSKTGAKIIKLLDALNEENGITIVVVTHDVGVAEAGDRIITLRDGEIIEDKKGKGKSSRSNFLSEAKIKG
jgi:putative ABC transport system ATP-binding protein